MDRAIQIHGAAGVSDELFWSAVIAMWAYGIYEGTSEAMRSVIPRDLLKNK
ncbi:MAG: hypothetical protein Ct9H300mP4_01700 [Gammaproteobacteria bacterium]|nr:MAG: hypothetical protein Ct9H300mP4_01700 [Gammaproteobacteria bacterium]